jgi:hypothetical protein
MDKNLEKRQLARKLAEYNINSFYYFTYIENLKSILEHGILPKNEVIKRGLKHQSFAEETVQARRHYRRINLTNNIGCTIHDVVPVYLIPKTPTLFARRNQQYKIIFIRIQTSLLQDDVIEFAFTDGNAASRDSNIFTDINQLIQLPWDVLNWNVYWNEFPNGKRKRNSEFMVYPYVPINYISELGVSNADALSLTCDILKEINSKINARIICEWFF